MSTLKRKVIILSGPTASGKTSTSLAIAKELKDSGKASAIINFDSISFYKELNIGSAKPSIEERNSFDHYLFDVCSFKDDFNASDFIKNANEIIQQLPIDCVVILVGGSAFYIRALIKGMIGGKKTSKEILEKSEKLYEKEGIDPFVSILKQADPDSLNHLHINDHYRLRRAVEFYWSTKKPISKEKDQIENPYDFSTSNAHPDWDIKHFYLILPKPEHWEIIKNRTHKIIKNGLLEEVAKLLEDGASGKEKSLGSIGYKEAVHFLQNNLTDLALLEEEIFIATRQLAKSQKTFFNKITPKLTFHPINQGQELLNSMQQWIENSHVEQN